MPKTTNPATAADFEPYVAELRAEGMSDADVLVRYFKTARPGAEFSIDSCSDGAALTWTKSKYDATVFHVTLDCPAAGRYECVTEKPDYGEFSADTLAWSDELSLESALAWLANQLAERCPVAAGDYRNDAACSMFYAYWGMGQKPKSAVALEWCVRTIDKNDAEAARLRRMFGIAEPGEVTT